MDKGAGWEVERFRELLTWAGHTADSGDRMGSVELGMAQVSNLQELFECGETILAALSAAREDAARLDWLETELRKGFWGRRVLHFGEWDITCYPEGFHVSNDPAADPIIDGCSLRDALDAVKDQQLSESLNLDAGNSRYHKPLPPLDPNARRADGGR